MVKINFNATFETLHKRGGIGIVIRDIEGFVFAAKVVQIEGVLDSCHPEASTAYHALEFATDRGFGSVIVKGDALTVLKALSLQMKIYLVLVVL
ncbi:hypothetical protein PTKIN_Ptkin06aG0115100 [Pterospermum kingtungense]